MITDRIARYDEIEKYDEENNDMQRVLLLDEAQAFAVTEAEFLGIYSGYSELWELGFVCKEPRDNEERNKIEDKMNEIFIEKAEELIAEFLEEKKGRMESEEDLNNGKPT